MYIEEICGGWSGGVGIVGIDLMVLSYRFIKWWRCLNMFFVCFVYWFLLWGGVGLVLWVVVGVFYWLRNCLGGGVKGNVGWLLEVVVVY